jgi:hypothetical protein
MDLCSSVYQITGVASKQLISLILSFGVMKLCTYFCILIGFVHSTHVGYK